VATGCRQLLGLSDLTPDGGQIIIDATDAQAFDDAPDAEIPLGPWGNPVRLFPTSTTADDDPSFTDDLLELYFNRNNNIYVAKRATTADAWGTPALVLELSGGGGAETTPAISGNGLSIYFASNRGGGTGGFDVMMSTRATRQALWSPPTFVTELESANADTGARPTADDAELVMDSNRVGGNDDLYLCVRQGLVWSAPAVATVLSSPSLELSAMMPGNALSIYFESDRDGSRDLFTSTRPDRASSFVAPTKITELSTALFQEEDPWVSADGRTMMYVTNKDGPQQIYQVTR